MKVENILDMSRWKEMEEKDVVASLPEIALDLINNYVLNVGDEEYSFRDIEFYIHTPNHPDLKEGKDEPVVYPRTIDKGGKIFFHYSGMDIAFESDAECYGGILIRGLFGKEHPHNSNSVKINGPWKCMMCVMNVATELPTLEKQPKHQSYTMDQVTVTFRKNLPDGGKEGYHFYV